MFLLDDHYRCFAERFGDRLRERLEEELEEEEQEEEEQEEEEQDDEEQDDEELEDEELKDEERRREELRERRDSEEYAAFSSSRFFFNSTMSFAIFPPMLIMAIGASAVPETNSSAKCMMAFGMSSIVKQ